MPADTLPGMTWIIGLPTSARIAQRKLEAAPELGLVCPGIAASPRSPPSQSNGERICTSVEVDCPPGELAISAAGNS